jgi:hypothetical protein
MSRSGCGVSVASRTVASAIGRCYTGRGVNPTTETQEILTVTTTVRMRYIVTDVDAAIAFYTEMLGFHVDMHPGPGFAMVSRGNLQLLFNRPGARGLDRPCPTGRFPPQVAGTEFS